VSGEKQIDCSYCGKEKLSKDEIGLNKKLIHRQVERMMCLRCMAEYFETTEEALEEMIEDLKRQGCTLFG
jgi:effector-binding domain-containing protein